MIRKGRGSEGSRARGSARVRAGKNKRKQRQHVACGAIKKWHNVRRNSLSCALRWAEVDGHDRGQGSR